MSNQPLTTLVPSLPAQSLSELLELGEALQGVVTGFQVDLVDGKFVQAVSWPFNEEKDLHEALALLAPLTAQFEVGMDCMIQDPQQYFGAFKQLGVKRVIIHYGSTQMVDAIKSAREEGFLVGLGILNDTPLSEVTTLLLAVDFVQVMGIARIGVQGQPFDERTIGTIETLRAAYPELEIAVDGSVNEDTILRLKEAGANRFAPGSVISKSSDPAAALIQLRALIGLQHPTA